MLRVACIAIGGFAFGWGEVHVVAVVGWVGPAWSSGITVRFLQTGFLHMNVCYYVVTHAVTLLCGLMTAMTYVGSGSPSAESGS